MPIKTGIVKIATVKTHITKAKKTRPGRHVRHPKTGQLIGIPPRPDVNFNPAKDLLEVKRRV